MREVAAFWDQRPPTSFYFIPEALEFCDFLMRRLERRALRAVYLGDMLAFERATLELERARIDEPPRQVVRFGHDPSALLAVLIDGKRPRGIDVCEVNLLGWRGPDGRAVWRRVA